MDLELEETLKLIIDRYQGRTQGSVFILIRDFSWFNERNGQLTRLYEAGMITKPLFYSDGASITLTRKGRDYFTNSKSTSKENKPSVFISYNWGSEKITDELEKALLPHFDVKRDKSSIKPWGNLHAFMSSIRNQDYAVLIISDAYLKSDACLFEVMELMKEQQWDEHVMYIVTDDARGIYDTTNHFKYIKFWNDRANLMEDEIKKCNPAAVSSQAEELKKVQMISINIGTFLVKIKQSNNPELDKAISAVVERLLSAQKIDSPHENI